MPLQQTAFLALSLVLFLSGPVLAQNDKKTVIPSVSYEEYRLRNGLRVILHQDTSTPIVAVNVWYHVGSKNEVPGRTGFAHLFEHMMFQGSKNYDADYFTPLQEAGANINGSTTPDRTNYYEVVPSNFLELALFMEADRMGGLLEAMTLQKLNNQRDVVKNERRQNYDNRPNGTASEKIAALMYPENHPYHWPTIGSLNDLTAASLDDVKSFFRQYYVPNNASLVLAGDFDKNQAKKYVEKYFGPIDRGSNISRPAPPVPQLEKEIRTTVEDNVQLPRLYLAWHTVPQYAPDEAALDILASVLSDGRGSRLQSNLIYGKQIAQDVSAFHSTREIAGMFQIQATARPDKPLTEIEQEILREVHRLKQEPPTVQEMERALNQIEASFVFGLQTVLGKANQLNSYATFLGKPDYFAQDLERYRKVTAQDVQRVAQKYLADKKLAMSFVPRSQDKVQSVAQTAANQPTSVGNTGTKQAASTAALPKPGPNPELTLPKIERARLANGLEVLLVRQAELPIVSMNLVVKTGGAADPGGKSGTAALTAELIDEGTRSRSALEIANQVQAIGASLDTGTGWDSSSVTMTTLTKNLDKALDLFADVVVYPTFPVTELETRRRRLLVSLLQRKDNPNAIASVVYNAVLYGKNHPYGNVLTGNEASIKVISRDDLSRFYETFYRPNNAALIVVGDVTLQEMLPKLERTFADWKSGEVPNLEIPATTPRDKATIYLVDKPGAAQSVLTIGMVGVPRNTPDYFPLLVMNSILGGQFTSRVNMNLREDKGYTYGARTSWDFRRSAGPFAASTGVQTAVTKESVLELLKELRGIRGEIAVTPQELEYNKQSLIRRFPSGFETTGQISAQLANLVIFDLPNTYFNDYIARINAVTVDDVKRVANQYLDTDRLAILVVGDKSIVEPKLREIPALDIRVLDTEGNSL